MTKKNIQEQESRVKRGHRKARFSGGMECYNHKMKAAIVFERVRLPFLLVVSLIVAPNVLSQNAVKLHLPKKMAKEVSADTGRPVIFERDSVLTWGLSTKTVSKGDPILVLLWLYNPTKVPQSVLTCNTIDWFWHYGIDVFDSSGQRVLSLLEQEIIRDPGVADIFLCGRNFEIEIPPHSCTHGSFSTSEWDFARDFRRYYSLSPGRYLIVPSERDENNKPLMRTLSNLQNGLHVEVTGP